MRIGIDCRAIVNPSRDKAVGVAHYTYQLARHLIKNDSKNEYVLFFDRDLEKKKLQEFKKKNVKIRFFPFQMYKKFISFLYSSKLTDAFFERENLDILHSPVVELPPTYKGKTIVTVHDIAFSCFPKLYTKEVVNRRKKNFPRILKQADKIIAVSESTRNDVVKKLKIPAKKIEVVYHGLDKEFFKKINKVDIQKICQKYKITGDYILFLGKIEKRKNYENIIKAFADFRNRNEQYKNYKLVLAGQWSNHFKQEKDELFKLAPRGKIIAPGFIQTPDLPALFLGSRVFLMPSWCEGFGLSILEAMAAQTPVITSKISSMPETAGKAALLVDPQKVKEIADALEKVLTDKKLVTSLKKKGLIQVKKFSWDKCAQQTLKIYKKLNQNVSRQKNKTK
ncbi:MAG: glycosyltransferase family 1 protein [Patescibacteria group bacterium]|nr:glycosyltransferase family 1 protein [Patescibacteria group bacterium]